MRKFLIFLSFLLVYTGVIAQVPVYYKSIDFTKSGDELKSQMTNLITSTHTTLLWYTSSSYNEWALDTWTVLRESDLDPDNSDKDTVLLTYGYDDAGESKFHRTRDVRSSCHSSSCAGLWVREHTFAQASATPKLTTTQPGSGTDAHNLRAIDSQFNGTRSNRSFTEGSGNAGVAANGGFYPGDEWKGSVARIIMYMNVRYPSQCDANNSAISTNTYNSSMPDVFLRWNAEQAPSIFEKLRNEVIYENQGNRNPFIDNPYIATLIWGGQKASDTWGLMDVKEIPTSQIEYGVYPTVTADSYTYVKGDDLSSIHVYNYNGQLMAIDNNLTDGIIPLPDASGVYIIKIQSNQGDINTYKVIRK
ncbi:MAG: endonuclease [Flavobacteriaceae bacterium]|jgi:hypothetical protein|nr:endonuclease [Flavobacteriaceae bacterium]